MMRYNIDVDNDKTDDDANDDVDWFYDSDNNDYYDNSVWLVVQTWNGERDYD
jgi:hypothetical protein